MLLRNKPVCSLLQRIVYLTSNSRKQTTPKLIRNPNYTLRGTLQPKSKSYKYNLDSPHVSNKHLYWNREVDNKRVRKEYKLRRFKKLGIRSVYQNGVRVVERPLAEILRELRDRKLAITTPGRMYANIFEMYERFGKEAEEYKDLIDLVIKEREGTVGVMDFQEFSIYCTLLARTGKAPTQSLFVHFYHFLYTAYLTKRPLRFDLFAKLCRFFFDGHQKYPEELLFQKQRQLKIFEDNDPVIKGFDVLVNEVYSKDYLKQLSKTHKLQGYVNNFKGVPGKFQQKVAAL